jgi:hypothetical protein
VRIKFFNTFQIVGYKVSHENQVVRKFRITADDGKDDEVAFYKLGVILSVRYSIKFQTGTQFRIWATKILEYFIIKYFF